MSPNAPQAVDASVLRELALPRPQGAAHKGARGSVLVIGGAAETPGAAILSGIAALRAGAGVLQIATAQSTAVQVAVAVPEARVIGLPETPAGDLSASGAAQLVDLAAHADAILFGPGLGDDRELADLLPALLEGLGSTPIVIDAHGLTAVTPGLMHAHRDSAVLTPNAREAAQLVGSTTQNVEQGPLPVLRELVGRFRCTVALRGAETFVGSPDGQVYHDAGGSPGLGSSGSGDVLCGFLTGLLARGAAPVAAAVWAVHVHARAGQKLSSRVGLLGYLARELLAEMAPSASELDISTQSG